MTTKNIKIVKEFSKWFCSQKYNLIFGGTETGLMLELVKNVFKKIYK